MTHGGQSRVAGVVASPPAVACTRRPRRLLPGGLTLCCLLIVSK